MTFEKLVELIIMNLIFRADWSTDFKIILFHVHNKFFNMIIMKSSLKLRQKTSIWKVKHNGYLYIVCQCNCYSFN